ncbi:MAG: hypothetical protein WBJ10_05100 [Daejeonella sp.]|uniref:hypothetical protein n=1 Tax=Daejeonella sp. TaxID=2805397 RepID=UPI003C7312B0
MQYRIFNHFLLPLLISICISTSTYAQSFNQKEQIVKQPIIKLFDALSTSDTAGLKLYTTRDVKFYEYGQVWPMDTLIHKVLLGSKAADFKRSNSFEFVSTTINRNIAWVTYYLQSTFTRNGKEDIVKWMETVILIKEKKQWKINTLHSTRLISN